MDSTSFCQCSICNKYNSSPNCVNYYTCNHNLCDECLFRSFFSQQFESLSSFLTSNSITLTCKVCNKGQFSSDIDSFIQCITHQRTQKEEIKKCKRHNMISNIYCVQCEQWFCKECIKIHNSIGNFHHCLTSKVPSKIGKCFEHQSKLKYYCKTCKKALCSCCITLEHKQHEFVHMNQFVNETIEGIREVSEKDIKDIVFKISQFNNLFDKEFKEDYIGNIDYIDKLIQTLAELKNEYINKMKLLQDKQNKINNLLMITYDKINTYLSNVTYDDIDTLLFINQSILNSDDSPSINIPKLNITKIETQHERITTQQSKLETLEDSNISFSNNIATKRLPDFKCSLTVKAHNDQVRCILELPDKSLASGSYKEIKIWKRTNNEYELQKTLSAHDGYIYSLLSLVNGNMASCGEDEMMIIWDTKDNYKQIQKIKGQTHFAKSILLLPDGLVASIAEDDTCINIRNPDSNYLCVQTLKGHTDMITSLILVQKDEIASASLDGDIRIWEKKSTYECVCIIKEHTKAVNAILTFKTYFDSNVLLSCSDDGYIKIYDMEDHYKCIQTLNGDSGAVINLIPISENRIASCSEYGDIKVWTEY